MKVTALVLAVLLALSLCACAPMNNRGTGTDSAVRGDSGNAAGTGADRDAQIAEKDADGAGTADAGNSGYEGNTGPDGPTAGSGGSGFDDDTNDKRFYYAGRLYEITEETVDPEDVGAELFSITDIVEDDPGAEGEGLGLDLDTRIYKFKNENEYDILAVRIGPSFRKATVREDGLIPSGNSSSGTNGNSDTGSSGTGNSATGAGANARMR